MAENLTLTKEQLKAIIDGCEGVTPGPWCCGAKYVAQADSYNTVAQCELADYDSAKWKKDAAHIARLDPVKAMATLALQSLDREGVTMETAHQHLLSKLPPTVNGDYAKMALEHAIKAVRDALDEQGGDHA